MQKPEAVCIERERRMKKYNFSLLKCKSFEANDRQADSRGRRPARGVSNRRVDPGARRRVRCGRCVDPGVRRRARCGRASRSAPRTREGTRPRRLEEVVHARREAAPIGRQG
jgi:hypothetical protein